MSIRKDGADKPEPSTPHGHVAGAEASAEIMADSLGWDEDRKARELAEYKELAAEHGLPSA